MTPRARFTEGERVREYLLAGRAVVTLVSTKTGARFTYRVSAPKKPRYDARGIVLDEHFVSVLCGSDNEVDYEYLGMIRNGSFTSTRGSRIAADAPSARAFAWAWTRIEREELPETLEVWHEGRCGRCGRTLTVPESLATGLGPVCEGKEG